MMSHAIHPAPLRLGPSSALALAAALMMVPANFLPVLSMSVTGGVRTDTILSGIAVLWRDGLWGIASIVFAASFLIPALKLLGLGWLLLAVHRGANHGRRQRTRLYAVLDFIGRWSMLDVFLVAFLAGTVQFGALASIEPRLGIAAFAAMVVLTILATNSFDPRWLWLGSDELSRPAGSPDPPPTASPQP